MIGLNRILIIGPWLITMPYNSKGQYVRWVPWLRWKRDKAVNHYGEKLLRLLAKLFYAQSRVGTAPVP